MGENQNQGMVFTPQQEARIREMTKQAIEDERARILKKLARMQREFDESMQQYAE